MQTRPVQSTQPTLNAVPPSPTNYVPAPDEVRTRTANPPTFGSAGKNILDLTDETWAGVTPGKRELLGIVAWLVDRFNKNHHIVRKCYHLLPYIREPPSYPALPLGWEAAVDELGRRFYVNQVTGKSQWCRPKNAVPGYVPPSSAPASTSFLTGVTPAGFPFRIVSNELPVEATAQKQPDTPRPTEADPEWRPRWPTTMPDTSTPRRSQRIRTMSERSTASAVATTAAATSADADTTTLTRRRSTRQQQRPRATPVRRSARLASRT